MWSLRGTGPIAFLPLLPSRVGLIYTGQPQGWAWGRLHRGKADLPSEIPSFLGVPAFPGHPQPIWVLLKDRLGRLSPSHYRPGMRVHMCVPVWVHHPGFWPQAGPGLRPWTCEPPNILV